MVTPITSITDRVAEALQNDPRTKDEVIDVSYAQGTLKLTGMVKSEEACLPTEEIARDDGGVIHSAAGWLASHASHRRTK